jgi:hypothetical protein
MKSEMGASSFSWKLWSKHSVNCAKNATKLEILALILKKLMRLLSFFAIKLQRATSLKYKMINLEDREDQEWKTPIRWVCAWAAKLESVFGEKKIIFDLIIKIIVFYNVIEISIIGIYFCMIYFLLKIKKFLTCN